MAQGALSLSTLPSEIRTCILEHLLCSEEEIEIGPYDALKHPNIFTPVLQVDKKTYLEGVSLLYGKNKFKFSSANELEKFVTRVNTSVKKTDLIPQVVLRVDLWYSAQSDRKDWIRYFKSASFQDSFPQLKHLEIEFDTSGGYDGDFQVIVDVLKANVKAWKIDVKGVGDKEPDEICEGVQPSEICNGMERTMTFLSPPETEEQRDRRMYISVIREYAQSVHPTDEWGNSILFTEEGVLTEKEEPPFQQEEGEEKREEGFW